MKYNNIYHKENKCELFCVQNNQLDGCTFSKHEIVQNILAIRNGVWNI